MTDEMDIPGVPGRSWLTNTQRQYLFGKDFDSAKERQIRYQMRQNLQSALMDMQLIWNMSEKDRYMATMPLSAYYELDGVAEWVLERNESNLKGMSSEDISDADKEIGGLMHEGIVDILKLYATAYGPNAYEELVQQGINKAVVQQSIEMGQERGWYDVNLEHIESVSEVYEKHREELEERLG